MFSSAFRATTLPHPVENHGFHRTRSPLKNSSRYEKAPPKRGLPYSSFTLRRFYALFACSACLPSAISSTSFSQNAGRSSGLRLVTNPWSVTTSSSTQVPPALRMSVCRLQNEVSVRPLTTSASTGNHSAWQMAATGFSDSKNPRTKSTASWSSRRKSGLATPPGSTRPSYSSTLASETVLSTRKVSALSRWLKAWISPDWVERSSGIPPAFFTASHGSVNSTCSVPSGATRKATLRPCNSLAMLYLRLKRLPAMPFWYPVGGAFKRDAYAFGSTISAEKIGYDLRELACDFRAGHGFKLVKNRRFEAFPLEPTPGEVREGIGLARG